ncbi:MAG: PIN domain-containing protein [Gammaproteobacteria bacterium]|nr:PIN domain-containing protein [Gammaproteobacteria bacterium]
MSTKLLIDTSVWLDLAKDYRLSAVLTGIEELLNSGTIELIMPRIVIDEFARNRDKVVEQSRRSFASHIKCVREAIVEFCDESRRASTLRGLSEVEHKIAMKGEVSRQTLERIESAMASSPALATSEKAKSRVVERALAKLAPFHRSKNSVADGLLLEIFAEAAHEPETEFFFVTHNTRDFSRHDGDRRLPHVELEPVFAPGNRHYAASIVEVIKRIDGQMLAEYEWERTYHPEPRWLSDILDAEQLLFRQVWYNRHMNLRLRVESGEVRIVTNEEFDRLDGYHPEVVADTVWKSALKAAKKTEEEVGRDLLGPWDDFEWGMINGKLSAIRWILGDEWDMLDT